MFTRKDRRIANLETMVENRDKLIEDLQERKQYYQEVSKEQRTTLLEKDELINKIKELTECNTYENEKAILSKIKELVRDYQSLN